MPIPGTDATAAGATADAVEALAAFTAPTRDWFQRTFVAPTPAQARAWAATAAGEHVLVSAPTGSGKTLAAFLSALDRLVASPPAAEGERRRRVAGTTVLYVSPLKALAYDIDRNLRAPLAGIAQAAARQGAELPAVDVALRTGDTPGEERRRQARHPPDILITTPESLYLLLTSAARQTLTDVETVIVDEVHAVAGTKRGAHLAVSLERLEALRGRRRQLQRIGLSATQRPLSEVARFLGGGHAAADAAGAWQPRPVTIVDAGARGGLEIEIVVPVPDMAAPGHTVGGPAGAPSTQSGAPVAALAALEPAGSVAAVVEADRPARSIWPAIHPRILDLVRAHRSTIVFCNSRRLAERLCAHLNELHRDSLQGAGDGPVAAADEPIARAHHGSVARDQRQAIEDALKAGRLRCVVATSSLELGIDMGAVDLVIQVESPGSVASGLQRVGRAGHHQDVASRGKVFPTHRGDLVEAAVVVRRMHEGLIEETRYPRTPLDVLAQHIVSMVAMDTWPVDELHRVVRGAAGFAELSRPQLDGVLDMLAGRYPADEFAELRPRLVWDRVADRLSARQGAQRLAVTSGGTIPDRGLYGVFVSGEGPSRRVGELDEEMVYETRPGETFTLGSTTWRVDDITRDQVLVSPAPGETGKAPFWHGDAPTRPIEVGRAVGAFLRDIGERPADEAAAALSTVYGLDELAAANLVTYLGDQRAATGTLPSDRSIVVERFRDEIGDWRVCVLSPFGGRVHAPWALAIEARARQRLGLDVHTISSDDGIVVRLPETEDVPPADLVVVDPDDVADLVTAEVANSALFAARFRECAARSLLLPRRSGGAGPEGMRRTPLWQQRQRAADLLAVASRYPSFPVVLETYRECLRDVFDVPALAELLRDVQTRRVRVTHVETAQASPFASSLLLGYLAGSMYDGDAPLAERRAQALSLDRELLAELLGSEELRELIDPAALADLELSLQRLTDERRARDADEVADLLRELGALHVDEVAARSRDPDAVGAWLGELERARRAYRLRVASEERWAAAEDAARYRDGLGIPCAPGLPEAFTEPVGRPLVDLVARYARTHGPFAAVDVVVALGAPADAVRLVLAELEREGRVVAGAFRPRGSDPRSDTEWCDADVLRRLRRRSLAALRREVEPVEASTLGRFLPAWQQVGERARGSAERVLEVIEQLQGVPLPASVVEADVLAVRVRDYTPAWLDELAAAGEIVWIGRGASGPRDGRVCLYRRDQAPLLAAAPRVPVALAELLPGAVRAMTEEGGQELAWWDQRHSALLDHLAARGASFWSSRPGGPGPPATTDEAATLAALWDLVWAGLVTNDTVAPLRALVGDRPRRARAGRGRPARAGSRAGPPAGAGRWTLVAEELGPRPHPTERGAALAAQLLDRHGVVVRDAVAGEDVSGGFAAVYPVLRAMEESGRARRGYFVEGLGGAQFAAPGAVDRLRSLRGSDSDPALWGPSPAGGGGALVLAATDPANPYGAALGWPDPVDQPADAPRHGPRRVAGARVVLVDGRLVCYLEKGGRSVVTFTTDDASLAAAAQALADLVASGRAQQLRIERIDAAGPEGQPLLACLRAVGFADHPRGVVLRRGAAPAAVAATPR